MSWIVHHGYPACSREVTISIPIVPKPAQGARDEGATERGGGYRGVGGWWLRVWGSVSVCVCVFLLLDYQEWELTKQGPRRWEVV